MTDVDLDDLYAQGDGDSQQQDEGQLAEAALPDSTAKDAVNHEQLLEQLRTQLQGLRDKFASAKKCPDYVDVAAQCRALCVAARTGQLRRAQQHQTASILDAAAAAAASGQDPLQAKVAAASAAAAVQRLTGDALAALLPEKDDGTICMLLHVSPQHSEARLLAFAGRYGPEPAKVYKQEGSSFALLVFAASEGRDSFVSGFNAAQQSLNAANSGMTLLLPGDRVPEETVGQLNGKRRRELPARKGAADKHKRDDPRQKGGGALPQQGPKDIRGVVCPWWNRPYHVQLKSKMESIMGSLRQMATEVDKSYPHNVPKPQWLNQALGSHNKTAVELPGIFRSPQIDGYRNKAEFSIGFDEQERPTVGFLQGNYVDGHTQVVDPSGCPHMSPTSLAYAAACTDFLRSPENKLPAWDKRKGQGFWRLLLVREGRGATFLPLPATAPDAPKPAAAGGDQQQQQRHQRLGKAPPGAVLAATPLADLPVSKWLVQNPLAAPPGQAPGAGAEGVTLAEVYEGEVSAPPPTHVLVMVQINPLAAPEGAAQIKQQLTALESALKASATKQGMALTSLAVQYHSGVANAAPATAPFTPFGVLGPLAAAAAAGGGEGEQDVDMSEAEGGEQVLGITDALCELKFRVSPTAFYQVNAGGTCMLYHTIGKMAGVGQDSLLLDVCCGTGTIGLTLAKQVSAVVGIDNVQSAISDAESNAQFNGITNASFICGTAEKVMDSVLKEHAPKYKHVVAVVDPPRVGLHKDVLFALLTCSAIKRLVYVSCNQDSLVLNSKILCGRYRPDLNAPKVDPRRAKRQKQDHHHQQQQQYTPLPHYTPFRPTKAMAFDLFPHTAHTEAVVLFERD